MDERCRDLCEREPISLQFALEGLKLLSVLTQSQGSMSPTVKLHQAQRRLRLWPASSFLSHAPLFHFSLPQFIVCQFASPFLSSWPHYHVMRSSHLVTVCCRTELAVLSAAHTCAMWRRYASSGGQKFTGHKWRLTVSHLYTTHWMRLLSFNTCACIHTTDARMHKITPLGNDYFSVFALWFFSSDRCTHAHARGLIQQIREWPHLEH